MASRLMFSNALRRHVGNGLVKKFARPFASETVLSPPITQSTLLSNGLTVATETNPYAQTATIGVWIDAGSRAENEKNNGAAHFLEHMAFKGTKNRTQHQLELHIENIGAHLNAYTSREQTVYYAKTFKKDAPVAVEILSDILQNSTLDEGAVEREREVILREQEEVDKLLEEVVFDHLHATAYQGHSLGRTILGPKENILSLKREDLLDYISKNYTADRMVLVGTGGVDHDELVKLAEKHFSSLPTSPNALSLGTYLEKPPFTGSEIRVRNDELPQAHIAISVESVGWTSPDYYPILVAQAIIGTWDRSLGSAPHTSPRLSHIVHEHHLANSYQAFNTSYSDTGLFGIYLISENKTQLDDLVHFTCKEFWRLHTSVTEAEVERAKQQLKASLLLNLDGTTAVAEDIGRQLITTGKRHSPQEVELLVSKVTVDDIRRVAGEYIWDRDIAVVGVGPVEALPDYNRIRGDMATNRF
ncbi:15692_t:CDS:2 [Acaulospora morrowiae]|uniref:mitochondrial processing peptidase n=1 Tax=Acaulospora morrowiae TaxID=94023 RepID=A0A9N9E561_9GLOM|nr:15692_t:CDS:2 [Acaulospora morrowiae]